VTSKENIQYLANILCVIYSDGDPKRSEEQCINQIAKEIGAKAPHIGLAFEAYRKKGFQLRFPFKYSYRIKNLEDMLSAAIIDGKLSKEEQHVIKEAFTKLELTKEQFQIISEEAKALTQPA